MQRTYVLLFVAALFVRSATAQTLSAAGNIPIIGTSQGMWSTDFQDPGAAGAGVTWDFSGLTSSSAVTYSCIDPSTSQWVATLPGATYLLTNSTTDTLFYTSTSNGLELVGEDVTYIIYDVQVPFSDNQLTLKLPCSLGTNWVDNIAASYYIDGLGTATRTGSFTGNADASGTLMLPGGTEVGAVLRVHTRLQQQDDAGIANATHARDEWAWYTQWSKFPVMRTVSDTILVPLLGINQVTRTTEWLDPAFVSVHDGSRDAFGLEAFPSPTDGTVTLTYGSFGNAGLRLAVRDLRGQVVLERDLGDLQNGFQRYTLELGALPAGCYAVELRDGSGSRSTVRVVRD